MSVEVGSIWRAHGSTRRVRVFEAGIGHVLVRSCNEQGQISYTLGRGYEDLRRLPLNDAGTALKRYTRVEVTP